MNDGGPAFPSSGILECDPKDEMGIDGVKRPFSFAGMSLRDWFAGMALQRSSEIVHIAYRAEQISDYSPESVARMAYAFSDAMIAERSKTP